MVAAGRLKPLLARGALRHSLGRLDPLFARMWGQSPQEDVETTEGLGGSVTGQACSGAL